MAAPTLLTEGTLNNITTGNNAPTIPTHQADDILVVVYAIWAPASLNWANNVATPASWAVLSTKKNTGPTGGFTGEWGAFWIRATGAGTTVSLTRPTNCTTGTATSWGARAYVIRGCHATGDPWDQATSSPGIVTTANVSLPALTVSGSERLALHVCDVADNTVPSAATGWTLGTSATSTTGTDSGQRTLRKDNVSADTGADATTMGAPAQGGYVFYSASFKPPAVADPRVPYTSSMPQLLAH